MQDNYYYTGTQDKAARVRMEIEHYEQCPKTDDNNAILDELYDTLYCIEHDC
jgi:hypothetical protein